MKGLTCEIAGCDRAPSKDVPATDRDGIEGTLTVCEPCHNAYMSGAKDPAVNPGEGWEDD